MNIRLEKIEGSRGLKSHLPYENNNSRPHFEDILYNGLNKKSYIDSEFIHIDIFKLLNIENYI